MFVFVPFHMHLLIIFNIYIYIYIYTYSFEGIEGTVQIATIAGSAGAFFNNFDGGGLQRFGFIVQSISVTSNMPLPAAP